MTEVIDIRPSDEAEILGGQILALGSVEGAESELTRLGGLLAIGLVTEDEAVAAFNREHY